MGGLAWKLQPPPSPIAAEGVCGSGAVLHPARRQDLLVIPLASLRQHNQFQTSPQLLQLALPAYSGATLPYFAICTFNFPYQDMQPAHIDGFVQPYSVLTHNAGIPATEQTCT